jgi:cytochrome d ubiquinol oxidase subunit II
MNTEALAVAGVLLAGLVVYAVSGGADFGGGVWDLLASGPRKARQRKVISDALGPIWEANHVWLILAVVLLFVCFPLAFAAMATALHIPLTVMLIGVVLRGSAFTFRSYGGGTDETLRWWGRVFASASVVTPFMLGVSAGAVASGQLPVDPRTHQVVTDFVSAWAAPFPLAVGLLAVALFAFLAAVYLTLETRDPRLQEDFRWRALMTAPIVFLTAWGAFVLARQHAPLVAAGLTQRSWSLAFHVMVGGSAVVAVAALWRRWYSVARVAAALHVALIVAGWGFAQFPYLLPPNLTVESAAAPQTVLRPVLWVLGLGSLVLLPSFFFLFRVFKSNPPTDA